MAEGCKTGVYEVVEEEEAEELMREGHFASMAFTTWRQCDGKGDKGRFIMNLLRHSKFWEKGSVNLSRQSKF